MTMQESLSAELRVAMKARDVERTGAIRILIGEFARQPEKILTDEQVVAIIKKLIKSERELLAAQKQEEGSAFLTIMEGYLPRQVSEAEISAWVEKNIDFSTFGNKMQAMRPIMQHFGSAADGNTVKKVLQQFA